MAGGKVKNTGVIAKDSRIKKQTDPQKTEFVDRENEIKNPQQDENSWKTRMLKIHNREITLKYLDPSTGTIHSEMNSEAGSVRGYKIEGTEVGENKIELEEGIIVTLEEPVSILETHTGAKEAAEGDDPAGSVYFMSPSGKMTFDFSKIKGMEDMKNVGNPELNLGMFQITANFNANGKLAYGVEISAYLRDSLKLKQGFQRQLELVQGEYQKKADGDGLLKFADSYVSTKKGKVNVPEMREIHFQETSALGNSSQSVESYYYKAFAATEVQLQNIEHTDETLNADSAKTKIFGFPAELKNVSIKDSEGKMEAKEADLRWRDGELKLEKVQIHQKQRKENVIYKYKKYQRPDGSTDKIVKWSVLKKNKEKNMDDNITLPNVKTAANAVQPDMEKLQPDEGIGTAEIDVEDGVRVEIESAILKQGNREIKLQNLQNLHMNEEVLEAKSAKMQYDSKDIELSDVKIEDKVQAKLASLKIGEGTAQLNRKEKTDVEITEEIKAPVGEMELYKHKVSMQGITIEKGLNVSANTASTEVDGFFTLMTGFHYTENGKSAYDYGRVLMKLNYGKESESSGDSKIQKKQQYMWFTIGGGAYNGSFEEGTKSTGFWATGNIEKRVVEEGTPVEDAVRPEKGKNQEKISEKRRNLLNRLKEKWGDKKKEKKKKAPKIITKDRQQEKLQQEIVTLDGFAKVVNATIEFEKKDGETRGIGEGDIKFQDIPFRYDINDVIKKPKTAFAPEESVRGVEFTIDNDGNLNVSFEDDAEAEFNLKGVAGKENSGEDTTFAITLGGFSIQNGYLKAGSASLERGIGLEQEGAEKEEDQLYMTKKAKKFFDCGLTGSIVNESKKDGVELTEKGIEAHLGETKLGKFGVSGFMGFLNGEVDFRSGEIAVSAEKAYEPEKLQESFVSLGKGTKGLDTTIPTPIPGVGVAFNITPSVGIAGAVGVGVKLGKPFDEWEKDSMELKGIVKGEGQAGITVGGGINLGAGYIASVDLKLGGGLSASIDGTLEGSTAFKFNKDKNAEKKMEQSKNLTFDGSLEGKLTGELNLNSTAKCFFWKKRLFDFKLWKKELGTIAIKGTGEKDKKEKNLFKGWKITSGQFNASWLSQEFIRKCVKEDDKGKTDEKISEQELETLVTEKNEEAKDAWAVLCKLRAQEADSDTAIILSKEDKDALDAQIEKAKENIALKCDECLSLLIPKKADLEEKLKKAKMELQEATTTADKYAQAQGLAEDIFQKAAWGGFDKAKYAPKALPKIVEKPKILNSMDEKVQNSEKYKIELDTYNEKVKKRNKEVEEIEKGNKTKNADASIDLMITYMLGQVSDKNIEYMNQMHIEENHMGMDEYIKHLINTETERLQKEADKLKGYAKELQEYKNKKELSDLEWRLKNDYKADYYMMKTQYLDTMPEYRHQNNYYSMLKTKAVYKRTTGAISHWDFDGNTYVFERKIFDLPMKLWKMIPMKPTEDNPMPTMEDILKHILTGNYTAKEKLDLIKKCFAGIVGKRAKGDDNQSDMINWGETVKKGLFEHMGTMYGTIFQDTEEHVDKETKEKKKAKLLEEVVSGKNVFDIFQRMEKLNEAVVQAADKVTMARNEMKEAQNASDMVKQKITEYQTILEAVKSKASVAVAPKNFSSDAAKETIRLYSKNYVEKMKGDVIKEELEKKIEANTSNTALRKSVGKL